MPRQCSVCAHPDRSAIDRLLVEGTSKRAVADQYPPLTASSVERHRKHLPQVLVCEAGEERAQRAQGTLEAAEAREEQMLARLEVVLKQAESKSDMKAVAALVREWRGLREFQEKRAAGGFRPPGAPVVNVQVNNGGSGDSDMSPEEASSVIRAYLTDGLIAPEELRAIAGQLESAGAHLLAVGS